MKNRTFPIDFGKFKCVEPYSENGIELVKGKTYEVYSYDSNFVYIWGIKQAKFSHRFFWEHFEEAQQRNKPMYHRRSRY